MHFTAEAELRLDALMATGDPPPGGEALVFTPDDADAALSRGHPPWVAQLPGVEYWSDQAPPGTRWFAAFRATEQGRVPSPPPSRGSAAELILDGVPHTATVVNDAMGEEGAAVARYFLAGAGEVPAAPRSDE